MRLWSKYEMNARYAVQNKQTGVDSLLCDGLARSKWNDVMIELK